MMLRAAVKADARAKTVTGHIIEHSFKAGVKGVIRSCLKAKVCISVLNCHTLKRAIIETVSSSTALGSVALTKIDIVAVLDNLSLCLKHL